MSKVRHVHPNLMRAARVQGALHQTSFFLATQAFKGGVRFFARQTLKVDHGHAQAISVVAANGGHDVAHGRAAPLAVGHG